MARVFEGGVEINTLSRGTGIDNRIAVRCATTNAITIATGLNAGDTIDGVTLVTGDRILVKNQSVSYEETVVTTVADTAGSLGGTYFLIDSPSNSYYVWFNVDSGNSAPTTASDLSNTLRTGIEIGISAGDSANDVAAALTADLNTALSPTVLTAVNTGAPSATVTITLAEAGNVPNTVDGADAPTGFGIAITNGGSADTDHGIWICDATPYRAEDLIAGDLASHIYVHVEEGATQQHTAWVCKNNRSADTVGTDALDWVQYASYNYTKGDLFVATSANDLGKVTQPSDISLLQIDGNGNVSWVNRSDVQAGFDPKESVRFATTAAIIGTYSASGGSSGTGAFTAVDLTDTGDFDLDGNTVEVGDRILIKNQADPKQNGIYVVTTAGATGVIERAADQDGANPASNLSSGNFTFIELGATLGQTGWVTQGDGLLAVNNDNIDWVQFNGAAGISEGPGIDITGNKVSLDPDNVTVGTTVGGVASTGDASVVSVISSGTTGQVLRSVGTAGNSATWGALDLANPNSVTGQLELANGGTGLTTGDYATGDILYYDAGASTTELQTLAFNDYSTFVAGATVPTWSTSVYADSIIAPDATGQTFVNFVDTASAVNNLTITNNATTAAPSLSATGTDTNIDLDLIAKGTGCVSVKSTGANPGCINFFDNDDSNAITLASPATVTTDRTWLLPVEDPTASDGYILQTDSTGQWSFVNPAATTKRSFMLVSAEITLSNGPGPGYQTVAYFAWDESEYGASADPRLVFYADNTSGGGGNRNILVRVLDSSLTVIAGPTTYSTDGIATLTITEPSADDYLIVQVQKSANGGSNPSIFGLQLELN